MLAEAPYIRTAIAKKMNQPCTYAVPLLMDPSASNAQYLKVRGSHSAARQSRPYTDLSLRLCHVHVPACSKPASARLLHLQFMTCNMVVQSGASGSASDTIISVRCK